MKLNNLTRRLLALTLAILLTVTMVPSSVLSNIAAAADTESEEVTTEKTLAGGVILL